VRLLGALASCLLVWIVLTPPAAAQPLPPNGYPDLVRAGRLLQKSRLFQKAISGSATLADKRQALLEKPVRDALGALRQGLSKQVYATEPRSLRSLEQNDLGPIRGLARLLNLQQYVYFADGRVGDALGVTRDCLRLGQAVQTGTLINGQMGLAMSASCLQELGRHVDQLSVHDCEALRRMCAEWLQAPNPIMRTLEGERSFAKRTLREQFAAARAEGEPKDKAADAAVASILEDTERQLDALYARLYEELRKPTWQFSALELSAAERQTPGGSLIQLLLPVYSRSVDLYVAEVARIRLLACHSAILGHRWDRDRLPASLAALELGELAVDPFTGQAFRYEVVGAKRYRLTSAGARATDNDPLAVDGRRPISVTPE
jgi:hypothetical protein